MRNLKETPQLSFMIEGEFADSSVHRPLLGLDLNGRSSLKESIFQVGQGNHRRQGWRAQSAGDRANIFPVLSYDIPVRRHGHTRDCKPRELFADVSTVRSHRNCFLACITPFCKAHRVGETSFQHHIRFINIYTVDRDSGLDPKRVQSPKSKGYDRVELTLE